MAIISLVKSQRTGAWCSCWNNGL